MGVEASRGRGVWFELELGGHLQGHGDLVSRLIIKIIRVTIWVIQVINPLTKSP